MVEQSRAQKLPVVWARQRSGKTVEQTASEVQGRQSRSFSGTHTSVTTPGSTTPSTPRQLYPSGQIPSGQSSEQTPVVPAKMQIVEMHSDRLVQGSPNIPWGGASERSASSAAS